MSRDGDEAGKKYAATVRSLLNNDREEEREHPRRCLR